MNQRLAHLYKFAPDDKCLLCGEQDGGHHAVSGCKSMERPVTSRHNGAVRALARALIKGRHGAKLEMMDGGSQEKREAANIHGQIANCIQARLLPKNMKKEAKKLAQRTMKPDILVTKTNKAGVEEVHLVEVKYCRDTNRSWQEGKAEDQHKALMKLLTDPKRPTRVVKLHKVLLGVGGTMYKDTRDQLKELGMDKAEIPTFLERLSLYAVRQMHEIICIRRGMEAAVRRERGEPYKPGRDRSNPWAPSKRAKHAHGAGP